MAKNKHLTFDDRLAIEAGLRNGASFSEIGRDIGKDPSTIAKEIRNHIKTERNSSYNPCKLRSI